MMITIEERIADLESKARDVLFVAQAELSKRLVYLHRARVLTEALSATLASMTALETQYSPNYFSDAWRDMRMRLAHCQTEFERIIIGADASQRPCGTRG